MTLTMDNLIEITQAPANKFCGFTSLQTHTSYYALEDFLNRRQDIKRIVEFGTFEGGLTIFFGLHMWKRGGQTLTFDTQERQEAKWFEVAKIFGIEFVNDDIYSSESQKKIIEFIQQPGITLVFCDNGNKPHEVNYYTKYLKPGDIIMAHDWGTEINPDSIEVLKDVLEPCEQESFDNLKTRIMSRVKK